MPYREIIAVCSEFHTKHICVYMIRQFTVDLFRFDVDFTVCGGGGRHRNMLEFTFTV